MSTLQPLTESVLSRAGLRTAQHGVQGWRDAKPMLQGLIDRWLAFHRLPLADNNARIHIKKLTEFLWSHRKIDQLGTL